MVSNSKFSSTRKKTQRGGETTISKFSNLFVSNLPEGMTEAKLSEVFGAHGEILSAVIK
jgi:RNA recognition motif-containing protein